MIHYICKYTPVEVLEALGQPCQVLDGMPENFDLSDAMAHPNLCGFGKAVIQACMAGGVEELVLVNCCDTIKRAYDVIKHSGVCKFLYFMDLPHESAGCGITMMEEEIRKLTKAYCAYKNVRWDEGRFLQALQKPSGPSEPYIGLLGARVGKELENFIADTIRLPVKNLTCVENRNLQLSKETLQNLPEEERRKAYSRHLLSQTPCQRMHNNAARRLLVNDPNLKGIVYHTVKFCDFYGFEYMEWKATAGVPLLKIETDYTLQSKGQMATRLEAFEETLTGIGKEQGMATEQKEYVAGIDSGSTSTDVVILDRAGNIAASAIVPTGAGAAAGAEKALSIALHSSGISREDVGRIVTTGYGRAYIESGDKSITEITCHAKGAYHLNPNVRTILDIGGQDSKVIRIDSKGNVVNFVMNDKCAAGTGRFLEAMARALGMTLEELGGMGERWKETIVISSMCTVFAESEVVSLVAQNKDVGDIVHGLCDSVAAKIDTLLSRLGPKGEYMMTGGVAKNRGVVQAISQRLGEPVLVSEASQLCGALGAALFALE